MLNFCLIDYEESSAHYRVVADTSFRLENNEFGQFNLSILKFPGINIFLICVIKME